MGSKTAWEHVLDEPVALEPGETPMKVDIDARFEGTVEQFITWVNDTFKNPNEMRVKAAVGNAGREVVETRVSTLLSTPARQLIKDFSVPEKNAQSIVDEAYTVKAKSGTLSAIKWVRGQAQGMGLREAKDFVEGLPSKPTAEDEIPF